MPTSPTSGSPSSRARSPRPAEHLAGVTFVARPGHQWRSGQHDHPDHQHEERQRLEGDPSRAHPQPVAEQGETEHDADQWVDGHERGPRGGDRAGMQRVLQQEDRSEPHHRQHVGLEMGEDVTPAELRVVGDGFGQGGGVAAGDGRRGPERRRPPPPRTA